MSRFRKILSALLVCCLMLGVGVALSEAHTHKWSEWKEIKKATCTDSGESRRTCTVAGCDAVENDYNKPPALGHNWGAYTLTTAATCTEEGVETSRCSRCEATQTRAVAKKAHQMTGYIIMTPATCTTDGLEENKCVTCSTQNQTRTISKKGHTWADWNPTTPATCEAAGTATRVCTVCAEKETKALDALGHTFGSWHEDTAATCTEGGTLKRVCSRCAQTETKSSDKLGHNYGLWKESKAPTCSIPGEKSRVCSRCADVQKETISALGKNQANGHTFSAWKKTKEATCTAEGQETRTCSDCTRVENRAIAKIPHKSNGIWEVERKADLTKPGLEITHCSVCGGQASSRNFAPRGYKYEIPTVAYGPLASEYPGGMGSTLRLIYLDLSYDSDQRLGLVTEDGWLIGYAHVVVANGTVRVSIEKKAEPTVMRYRAWGMFPDAATVKAVNYDNSLPFDQAVKGPEESCVIALNMISNYYQGSQNERFSDGLLTYDGEASYQQINQQMLEMAEGSGE